MKVIVASDSFKGTLTSKHIGEIVQQAAFDIDSSIQVRAVEIADGGEGSVDAFFSAAGESRHAISVQGPADTSVETEYCVLQDGSAVLEVASIVGLAQHRHGYNPLKASSFGVGQAMLAALQAGYKKLTLCLGGSCTTDGGIGLAAALGFGFVDAEGHPVEISPQGLACITSIDTREVVPAFWDAEILCACDVTNPLYGTNGAAFVFGPQKGATPDEVTVLDEGLQNLASVIFRETGTNLQGIPGAGAAGGMSSILLAYGHASICSGLDLLLQAIDLDELISDADLIITGEGKLDSQSLQGKVPLAIAKRGKQAGKRVIALVGSTELDAAALESFGISAVYAISSECADFRKNLKNSAENYYRTIRGVLQSELQQNTL